MILNIHAGHNPDGKVACGSVGILKESTEARKVKDLVISQLQRVGHTVYDCTVDNGSNQSDVLAKIVSECNSHSVDLDVSIHLNSGRNDYEGDGSIGGTEVWCYNEKTRSIAEGSFLRVLDRGHHPFSILLTCCLQPKCNHNHPACTHHVAVLLSLDFLSSPT